MARNGFRDRMPERCSPDCSPPDGAPNGHKKVAKEMLDNDSWEHCKINFLVRAKRVVRHAALAATAPDGHFALLRDTS